MKSKMPLVSIIVPSYNHSKYIEKTIMSIVQQTYNNIELIVIDDGSTDTSLEVIELLAKKYKFKFIYRANKGVSATLNEGLALSHGKYICVCASDDVLTINKIEKQVNFMENNLQYAMSYAKVKYIDKNDKIVSANNEVEYNQGFIFNDIIRKNFISAVTVILRKDVFNDVGYFDVNSSIEDFDMWLRIANKCQIGFIDEYLAFYRYHETNNSKNFMKMYKSQLYILKKWEKCLDFEDIIFEFYNTRLMNLAVFYKKEAIHIILKYKLYLIMNNSISDSIKIIIKLIIPRNIYDLYKSIRLSIQT